MLANSYDRRRSRRPTAARLLTIIVSAILLAQLARAAPQAIAPSFYLRDGDTVVFYGDSITFQRGYREDVETYVLTRFPTWRARFINAGWSGDTTYGGGGGKTDVRLARDVFPYKPTVVVVFFGMNDGCYYHFDPKIRDLYVKGVATIIDRLRARLPHVRITLIGPPLFDYSALPNAPKSGIEPTYNDVLIKIGETVRPLAVARHVPLVELNEPMRTALAKGRATDPKFSLTQEGIHPNAAGHRLVAALLLSTWRAPTSPIDIFVRPGPPTRIAVPLPWPMLAAARPIDSVSTLPSSLGRVRLRGEGLTAQAYRLTIDGTDVGVFVRERLAAGIEIDDKVLPTLFTQAAKVREIVDGRTARWRHIWQEEDGIAHYDDVSVPKELAALAAVQNWLDLFRVRAHAAAPPVAHSFTITPVAGTSEL